LTDLTGGGPFELPRGGWTDDTAMALCLAESLVECHGFNAADQVARYRVGSATDISAARGSASVLPVRWRVRWRARNGRESPMPDRMIRNASIRKRSPV